MPAIPVLEVAISLLLLYFFFSQVVTSLYEMWATARNKRGRYLRAYLNQALNSGNDKNWAELVYRHPSVDMLVQKTDRPPAYVPSSVFVKAIVDLVIDEVREHKFVPTEPTNGAAAPANASRDYVYQAIDPTGTTLANFEAGLAKVKEGDFKALMRTLLLNAHGCTSCERPAGDEAVFTQFIHGLAVWYDDYMARVSGWYKRDIRLGLFGMALLVAVGFNLDSLHVANYLWSHSTERQRIVAYAATVAADSANARRLAYTGPDSLTARAATKRYLRRVDSLATALQTLGFPIGWSAADPVAPTDSSLLPPSCLVPVPAATILRLPARPPVLPAPAAAGQTALPPAGPPATAGVAAAPVGAGPPRPALAWRQPAHYRHYQRRTDTTRHDGLLLHRTTWESTVVDSATAVGQGLPIRGPEPARGWLQGQWSRLTWLTVLGWLLTAAALSVGAPFWFELLNRFVNVRNLGMRPPTASPQ